MKRRARLSNAVEQGVIAGICRVAARISLAVAPISPSAMAELFAGAPFRRAKLAHHRSQPTNFPLAPAFRRTIPSPNGPFAPSDLWITQSREDSALKPF